MNWINVFGLIIMIIMLGPNIIYARKFKDASNKCTNKLMNAVEQTGRYGSMFLMIFNIGIAEFGFKSDNGFAIWLTLVFILLTMYWIIWFLYFKKQNMLYAMLLAVIPSVIFILSGFILRHWLLLAFGIIFSIGHIYVTYKNNIK